MGCAASCVQRTAMSLFGRNSNSEDKAKLDRKLYIAKESPEPVFDLSECQLRQVPAGIYSICKVYRKEYIYLNNNKLQSLDSGGLISDLFLIKVLNISFNQFHKLSSDIRYLVNLTELYIQNNNLISIPDDIQHLQCLQILDVSCNKLTSLTPLLGNLKSLQTLKVNGNPKLTELCAELCQANNIINIELDHENFVYPPSTIVSQGTVSIMKYLCHELDIPYKKPQDLVNKPAITHNTSINPFAKRPSFDWEEKEAEIIEQENKHHEATKKQREKFLSQVLQDQSELDAEIAKVHGNKDVERQKLIQSIQEEEKNIECLVNNLIQSNNLKPEVIQQQLQHEQSEHDHLLKIIKQNYDNIRKTDVLQAMEKLLNETYSLQSFQTEQQSQLDNFKQNILMEELASSDKLKKLLEARAESHAALTQQILEDQDIQKAVVVSLIERVDARSWSLNQEISLVSSNLAKLSVIEQEKKKMHVAYNFNELLQHRTQLLHLLDDLLHQQNKRRAQLIATMKEVESENNATTDFWLKSYQKVIESAPKTLLDMGKKIDPLLANYLLQEGVIHCLPFLVKFLFSNKPLVEVTGELLRENGVTLTSDRDRILRAIEYYVNEKNKNNNFVQESSSAPRLAEIETDMTGVISADSDDTMSADSECVICMDTKCEVVFVPCGHLCCCLVCSNKETVQICPMCRSNIDRKIKVIPA